MNRLKANVDECQPNPCVHGTCTDGVNRYTCQCSPGHRGDNCDEVRPVRYVRVTPANGTAFASSEYSRRYLAAKAFGTSGYWCSEGNPDKPVRLWFEFNEPKLVSKIQFEEEYELESGSKTYQVFASEAVGDCGNITNQELLAEAEHGVFKTVIKFDNQRYFRCYGIRTYHQGARYVGLRKVMFGVAGAR